MKSPRFDDPRVFVVKGNELPLSGLALLELMRAVLAKGVPFRFCARGWSMVPFIRDGDVITISPLPLSGPSVGEVVAFVRPGTGNLVVHRVIDRRGAASVIQGDNEPEYRDSIVSPENVLGRVTRLERDGNAISLSLGPERYAIAWLSRLGLLVPLHHWLSQRLKPVLWRCI